VRLFGAFVVLVAIVGGCTSTHAVSATFTMHGRVYVNSDGLAGCNDFSSYADVKAGGGNVVITDDGGATVATTHLSDGTSNVDRSLGTSGCTLTFTATVPRRRDYRFTISGHRPLPPSSYAFAELQKSHWKPDLLIGTLPPDVATSTP
jgi:hypothetical protein